MPVLPAVESLSDDVFIVLIGSFAASLTTGSFLPQIVKGYRTKKMDDVSPYLMIFFASGTMLWLAYGMLKSDLVIIGANALGTSLNLLLLFMRHIYRRTSSASS